jgi:hypothetical protein
MPPLNLYARVRYLYPFCTRDRGCSAHPAFPAPSDSSGAKVHGKPRAHWRGEGEGISEVAPSLRAQQSNPASFLSFHKSWIASSQVLLAMTALSVVPALNRDNKGETYASPESISGASRPGPRETDKPISQVSCPTDRHFNGWFALL